MTNKLKAVFIETELRYSNVYRGIL